MVKAKGKPSTVLSTAYYDDCVTMLWRVADICKYDNCLDHRCIVTNVIPVNSKLITLSRFWSEES